MKFINKETKEILEFIVFNIDGVGSALIKENNECNIIGIEEVKNIIMGEIGKPKLYEPCE
jgi:hypothetical protein